MYRDRRFLHSFSRLFRWRSRIWGLLIWFSEELKEVRRFTLESNALGFTRGLEQSGGVINISSLILYWIAGRIYFDGKHLR